MSVSLLFMRPALVFKRLQFLEESRAAFKDNILILRQESF